MARFLTNNIIDTAILSTDSTMLLPLDNVKVLSKSAVSRFNSQSIIVEGSFLGIQNVNCFIIIGHNIGINSNIIITLYNTFYPIVGAEIYEYSNISVQEHQVGTRWLNYIPIWFDNTYRALSFSITIDNYTSSYIQIYRLFSGEYFETEVNISKNNSIYRKKNTKQYRTEAGTLRSDNIVDSRIIDFEFPTMREEDRKVIQKELAKVGMRKEFYLDIYPESTRNDYRGLVKLTKVPQFSEYLSNIYRSTYSVEEV